MIYNSVVPRCYEKNTHNIASNWLAITKSILFISLGIGASVTNKEFVYNTSFDILISYNIWSTIKIVLKNHNIQWFRLFKRTADLIMFLYIKTLIYPSTQLYSMLLVIEFSNLLLLKKVHVDITNIGMDPVPFKKRFCNAFNTLLGYSFLRGPLLSLIYFKLITNISIPCKIYCLLLYLGGFYKIFNMYKLHVKNKKRLILMTTVSNI